MESTDIDIIIARFLAREASEEEAGLLLEWLKASDGNKRYFREQEEIWHALHPAYTPEEIDVEKAQKRLSLKTGLGYRNLHSFFNRLLQIWGRIAAVLILPLIALIVYMAMNHTPGKEVGPVTVATAYGCTSHFFLPDSSEVWLNSNSKLEYIPTATACRDIALSGEAYFNVKSDVSHPFAVTSSRMKVTATGTGFNVNAYGLSQSVTLVEGKVDVAAEGDNWMMKAGEHLNLEADGATLTAVTDVDRYCSWRNGMLIFDDDPLSDICSRLQQLFYVDIDLEPAVADKRFHIILNGEDIHEFVYLLQLSKEVKCDFDEDRDSNEKPPRMRISGY